MNWHKRKYTKEQFIECWNKSETISECANLLGLKSSSHIPSLAVELNLAPKIRTYEVSDETKRKISIARSKYLEENENGGGFSDVLWYKVSNILGEEFIVRGLLERDTAELLNSEGRIWIRKIYLHYYDSAGDFRTYSPDFYLPNEDLYLETKGYFSSNDQLKLDLVLEQNNIRCLNVIFSLWDEVDRSNYLPGSKRKRGEGAVRPKNYVSYTECVQCGKPTRSKNSIHSSCRSPGLPLYKRETKIDWPDTEDLISDLKKYNFEYVALNLGVSSNAIRNRLKVRGIDIKNI